LINLGEPPVPTSGPRSARTFKSLTARRDWAPSEKRRIVAEMALPGTNVSALARRHGVAQSQLYQWRKLFAGDTVPAAVPHFVALTVAPASPETPARQVEPERPIVPSRIEIELKDGRVVRVDADVDASKLAAIIAALETKA
jgi:transposase